MIKKIDTKMLNAFEEIIGYSFYSKKLLIEALTHSSYANEHKKMKISNNERLEFLGDAILDLIISDYIFRKYPNDPEGDLTKLRASIVCEPSLANASRNINVGDYIFLGKGEELTGGRTRDSILADAFEAIIGAIYLDSNIEKATGFVMHVLIPLIAEIRHNNMYMDYKTHLQEILQKVSTASIDYYVVNESGPDHNKRFFIEVRHCDVVLGTGEGKSKKEAEQNAALKAIQNIQTQKTKKIQSPKQ